MVIRAWQEYTYFRLEKSRYIWALFHVSCFMCHTTTCLLFSLQKHKPNGRDLLLWNMFIVVYCIYELLVEFILRQLFFLWFFCLIRNEIDAILFIYPFSFSHSFSCIFRINEKAWMKSDAIQAGIVDVFFCFILVFHLFHSKWKLCWLSKYKFSLLFAAKLCMLVPTHVIMVDGWWIHNLSEH